MINIGLIFIIVGYYWFVCGRTLRHCEGGTTEAIQKNSTFWTASYLAVTQKQCIIVQK